MIAYLIGTLVAGLAVGAALGLAIASSRQRRAVANPAGPSEPEGARAAPVPPPPGPPTGPPPAEPPPAERQPAALATVTNLEVAEAVLEVADRLASRELCRRLGDALHRLDGVSIVTPEAGAEFEPDLHDWIATQPVSEGHLARTIAATKVPGLTGADGTVIRKARVTIYE